MVLAFNGTCKSYLKFSTTFNKKGDSYYIQELYSKIGEEAIYYQFLIKDIILPKFIDFIFEDNNIGIIDDIILLLIFPEISIKNIKYILVGSICIPSVIHINGVLFNYQYDYSGLKKGKNYYYEGKENNRNIKN